MTVVGGGELFTGNTAMVTAAAIEGKASAGGLLKNWVSSYIGNFIGCVVVSAHALARTASRWTHCKQFTMANTIVSSSPWPTRVCVRHAAVARND